jgi:hypothetical protein
MKLFDVGGGDRPVETSALDDGFSDSQLQVFTSLRNRYGEDHDFLDEGERMHLRFIRWLHQMGVITP